MSKNRNNLKEKIRKAKHQSKPDEASLVVRDGDGNWLFEVYDGNSKGVRTTHKLHRRG